MNPKVIEAAERALIDADDHDCWNPESAPNYRDMAESAIRAVMAALAPEIRQAFLRYEDAIKQRAMGALFYDDLAPHIHEHRNARRDLLALLGIPEAE